MIEAKRLILVERKVKRDGKKVALEVGSDVEEDLKEGEEESGHEEDEYKPIVEIEEIFGVSFCLKTFFSSFPK